MDFKIVDNVDMDKIYSFDELRPKGVRNFMCVKSSVACGKTSNGRPYYPTRGYEYFNTAIGRLELSKWIVLMEKAIEAAGVYPLYEKIVDYSKNNLGWIRKDEEIRIHSAECLLSKAYDHWADFDKGDFDV